LSRRHESDISCAPALTQTSRDVGERLMATSGKPAEMAVKTVRNLRQRATLLGQRTNRRKPEGKRANAHTDPVSGSACKSTSGANGDGDGNVSPKLQAQRGKERRARQTERCPANNENKLCRGKPHGRSQGGKDLASDEVGAQRCKTAWSTQRHRAQAEQAASNRKQANPGR
jgi:hypothetical protein